MTRHKLVDMATQVEVAREYLVERLYRDSRILGEAVNLSLLAGAALVVGGVYLTNRPR